MSNGDENTIYQALIVTRDRNFPQEICTTLVTKRKCEFDLYFQDKLPSNGATLKKDFLPINDVSTDQQEENLSKRYGARIMLVFRKLSQLVAKSWTSTPEGRRIKKLMLTANLEPNCYDTSNSFSSEIEGDEQQARKRLYDLAGKLASNPDNQLQKDAGSTTILPGSVNWQYVRFSLLCAGQAYWKNRQGNYQQICPPILSTYEICVTYALSLLQVSASNVVTTTADVIQYNDFQKPPYYKVALPYPPMPVLADIGLTNEELEAWADAPEEGGDYPFYPTDLEGRDSSSEVVTNTVPPLPYILLACSC